MIKKITLLTLLSSFLFANYGTLRILVDYGQKENISIKNCTSKTLKLDDFPYLNKNNDFNKTTDSFHYDFTKPLYTCIPPYLDNSNIDHQFKPTIIMFNDTGLRGVSSLINKKLLSSSSINKLIYTFLLEKQKNNNILKDVKLTQNTLRAISRFNPKHFYFAITPDLFSQFYSNNNFSAKGNEFIKDYLSIIKDKLIKENVGKKEIVKKIHIMKQLIFLNFYIYSKLYGNYVVKIKPIENKKMTFYSTGNLDFHKDVLDNYACTTCLQNAIGGGGNCSSVCNKNSSKAQYEQCENRTKNINGLNTTDCMVYNTINNTNTNPFQGGNNQGSNDIVENLFNNHQNNMSEWGNMFYSFRYNQVYTSVFSSKDNIKNNLDLTYQSPITFNDSIVKNADGTINEAETKRKENIICRKRREKNVANSFNLYSTKYEQNIDITNIQDVDMNLLNKDFNNIILDIHKTVLTNNIKAILNEDDCINGTNNLTNNVDLLTYVNIFKMVNGKFIPYSSKLLGKNLNIGYNEYNDAGTLPKGKQITIGQQTAEQAGGTLEPINNQSKPITNTNISKCGPNESVLILFWNNLNNSLNISHINKINQTLNNKLGANNFFDIGNNDTYLGCYKDGHVTKWVKKINKVHVINKDLNLNCINKWQNESTVDVNNAKPEDSVYNICLNSFLDNLKGEQTLVTDIYDLMNNKEKQDNVVFGLLTHSFIYHETNNNYAQNVPADKPLFLNNVNNIRFNSYNIKPIRFEEIVCKTVKEAETIPAVEDDPSTKDVNESKPEQFINGEVNCTKNISKQLLQVHSYLYKFHQGDLISSLNSYQGLSLSDMLKSTAKGNIVFNISKTNPQYFINNNLYTTLKQCNIIYNDISLMNKESYINDMINCLVKPSEGEDISDYQTTQTYIKSLFPNLTKHIQDKLSYNHIGVDPALTQDDIYNKYLSKSGLYYYYDMFHKDNTAFTPNDKKYYQIELKNIDNYINILKGY